MHRLYDIRSLLRPSAAAAAAAAAATATAACYPCGWLVCVEPCVKLPKAYISLCVCFALAVKPSANEMYMERKFHMDMYLYHSML